MDPDVALRELRELAARCLASEGSAPDHPWVAEAADALQRFTDLDTWLTRGGFPPAAWNHQPRP